MLMMATERNVAMSQPDDKLAMNIFEMAYVKFCWKANLGYLLVSWEHELKLNM